MRIGSVLLALLPCYAFAQTSGLPALREDLAAEAGTRAAADARLERAVAVESARAAAAEAVLSSAISAPAARLRAVDSLGNVLGDVIATRTPLPAEPATSMMVLRDGAVWRITLVAGRSAVGPANLDPPSLVADKFATPDCSGETHTTFDDYLDVGPLFPANTVFMAPGRRYVRVLFPPTDVVTYSHRVWDPVSFTSSCVAVSQNTTLYRVQDVTVPQEVCHSSGCPHLNWPVSFELY